MGKWPFIFVFYCYSMCVIQFIYLFIINEKFIPVTSSKYINYVCCSLNLCNITLKVIGMFLAKISKFFFSIYLEFFYWIWNWLSKEIYCFNSTHLKKNVIFLVKKKPLLEQSCEKGFLTQKLSKTIKNYHIWSLSNLK